MERRVRLIAKSGCEEGLWEGIDAPDRIRLQPRVMVGWTRLYRTFLRTLGTPGTWQRSSQSRKNCVLCHSRNTVKATWKGWSIRPVIAGTVQLGLRHDQTLMPTSYTYAISHINHMQLNHHHSCKGSPRPSVGRAASRCSERFSYPVRALLIAFCAPKRHQALPFTNHVLSAAGVVWLATNTNTCGTANRKLSDVDALVNRCCRH